MNSKKIFEIIKIFFDYGKDFRISLIKNIKADPRGYRSSIIIGVDEQTATDLESGKFFAAIVILPIDEVKKVEMELKEKNG